MSYTKSFHGSVSGSKTVSVSYPASEHGGSTSVTVNWQEPVNIEVQVDTRPFDRSVHHCGGKIQTLTGAVVATEAAHVAAIAANANRVSTTVLNGFFGLIRSEISQQILEYRTRCEALILKLNDMMSACRGKKNQMQKDYDRFVGKYGAVFHDLDRELANRIHAIDEAAFSLQNVANQQTTRAIASPASTVPAIYGGEESHARASLAASAFRRNALQVLQSAQQYLVTDREVSAGVRSILTSNNTDSRRDFHAPVLYTEMDVLSGGTTQETLAADASIVAGMGKPEVQNQIRQKFRDPKRKWTSMDDKTRSRIEHFLQREIAATAGSHDDYQVRVAATIIQLWNASLPAVPW